jgi:integrase/recombinase XerC
VKTRKRARLISSFTQHLRASGNAKGTIEQRIGDVRRLSMTFPDLMNATAADLELYFADRQDRWTANYRRRVVSSVRIFYRWAKRSGHSKRNPAKQLATFKVPRGIPHPAPDEVILEAFDDAPRDVQAMLCLASSEGLRRTEITLAHPRDRVDDTLRVRGKGSKERTVPLDTLTLSLLRDIESVQGIDTYYFPGRSGDGHLHSATVYKRIKAVVGPDWTPHSLRHRAATVGLRATRDLRGVQEFLGHSSPETTQIYTQVHVDDLREISRATSLTNLVTQRRMNRLMGSVDLSVLDQESQMSVSEALSVLAKLEKHPRAK